MLIGWCFSFRADAFERPDTPFVACGYSLRDCTVNTGGRFPFFRRTDRDQLGAVYRRAMVKPDALLSRAVQMIQGDTP